MNDETLVLGMVLSAGIEPTLQAPQACVLSVERREQTFLRCTSELRRASSDLINHGSPAEAHMQFERRRERREQCRHCTTPSI